MKDKNCEQGEACQDERACVPEVESETG
jgi:hypothetical protein